MRKGFLGSVSALLTGAGLALGQSAPPAATLGRPDAAPTPGPASLGRPVAALGVPVEAARLGSPDPRVVAASFGRNDWPRARTTARDRSANPAAAPVPSCDGDTVAAP